MLFKSSYKLCAFGKMLGFQKFKEDLENSRTLCYHLYNSIIATSKKKDCSCWLFGKFLLALEFPICFCFCFFFFLLGSNKTHTHKIEMFLVLFKTHYKINTISKST